MKRLDTHASTAIGATLALHASLRPEKIPAHCGENLYKGNIAAIDKEIPKQIFAVSVISAAVFCRLHGREFAPPQPSYSYIENILHMMRFVEKETGRPDPRVRDLHCHVLPLGTLKSGLHLLTRRVVRFVYRSSSC